MILDDSTVARELLSAAQSLADRPADGTRGLWPRAAVLLARQSLEVALKTYWSAKAPGIEESSMRAQLLCLRTWVSNEPLARRAYHAWSALSHASHHHPYEFTPTREELVAWLENILEVVEVTESRRNKRIQPRQSRRLSLSRELFYRPNRSRSNTGPPTHEATQNHRANHARTRPDRRGFRPVPQLPAQSR